MSAKASSSSISIEGTLDEPVIHRQTAHISVHCAANERGDPGGALGVSTSWQVLVYLPRDQFADLVAVVAAQRLERVTLVVRGLKFGKGQMHALGFHTTPVPSRAED